MRINVWMNGDGIDRGLLHWNMLGFRFDLRFELILSVSLIVTMDGVETTPLIFIPAINKWGFPTNRRFCDW